MKNTFLLFAMISLFLGVSCSPKLAIDYERTGKVTCSNYSESVIDLQSESRAASMNDAVLYAERNAFENLLFKGIPKSNQEKPMIPNEYEALRKHPQYFKDLIMQEKYQRFITKSETGNHSLSGKVYFLTQNVSVDLAALRKDLEQNKIVRKFGL